MPTNTPNLGLEKPIGSELYDIAKLNANFDKVDANALNKVTYKGEVALVSNLPTTGQKVGDYYIVVEKGVPYLWDGDSFNPQVIIPEMNVSEQSIGALISSADAKVTPDVDDTFGYSDSEDVTNPNILKKLTWGNLRASLAIFFEDIFALVAHGHEISDVTDLTTALSGKAPSSHTHEIANVTGLTDTLNAKADKSVEVPKTLLASAWVGASAPYTLALTVDDVTTTSEQVLLPSTAITQTQLAALQVANIQDAGQSANTINLKAWGTKPTIDIPIRVILRG